MDSTAERRQDSPALNESIDCKEPIKPSHLKTLHRRAVSLDEITWQFDNNMKSSKVQYAYHYRTSQDQCLGYDKWQPQQSQKASNMITISIDKLTLKRNTLYDKAKLRVYLEQCRLLKKKAEFDQILVNEDELRLAIQDIYDEEITLQYQERDRLLQKIM